MITYTDLAKLKVRKLLVHTIVILSKFFKWLHINIVSQKAGDRKSQIFLQALVLLALIKIPVPSYYIYIYYFSFDYHIKVKSRICLFQIN